MRYRALATDYDETIAEHGVVRPATLKALRRVRESGRKLLLVTGRDLRDLRSACPYLGDFDLVVCENGAILLDPASGAESFLAEPPPAKLVEALRRAGVRPLEVCQVMIATHIDQEDLLLRTMLRLGTEAEMIVNKTTVMMLPAGVNKASGLQKALRQLGLDLSDVVAIGDAENDESMLARSAFAVAVANAVPELKAMADLITKGQAGDGAAELIELLLATDLANLGFAAGRTSACVP